MAIWQSCHVKCLIFQNTLAFSCYLLFCCESILTPTQSHSPLEYKKISLTLQHNSSCRDIGARALKSDWLLGWLLLGRILVAINFFCRCRVLKFNGIEENLWRSVLTHFTTNGFCPSCASLSAFAQSSRTKWKIGGQFGNFTSKLECSAKQNAKRFWSSIRNLFFFLKRCPGRGANLGSFGFRLFSLSKAAP